MLQVYDVPSRVCGRSHVEGVFLHKFMSDEYLPPLVLTSCWNPQSLLCCPHPAPKRKYIKKEEEKCFGCGDGGVTTVWAIGTPESVCFFSR